MPHLYQNKTQWLFLDLPITDYKESLALQERIVAARVRGSFAADVLIFIEHQPVFTLGKRGGRQFLRVTEAFLSSQEISVIQTERGGSITYHGPGQLVAYPVLSLKEIGLSVAAYVELLEEVMLRCTGDFGIECRRDKKNRGVWTVGKKIGSLGIRVKRNVAMHGLALNVCPDLAPFSWMCPCGLDKVAVTSLAAERGDGVLMATVRQRLAAWFAALFRVELKPVDPAELDVMLNEQQEDAYGKTGKQDSKAGVAQAAAAHGA